MADSFAALSDDAKKLMLYDWKTNTWSQLAEGLFAFQNWSGDLKHIYAEQYMGKEDDFVSIGVPDGKVTSLFSLKEVPRGFDPFESWMGLTDDEPLLLRDVSTHYIATPDRLRGARNLKSSSFKNVFQPIQRQVIRKFAGDDKPAIPAPPYPSQWPFLA